MTYIEQKLELNENFDLAQVISSIKKPLSEIMRLHELFSQSNEITAGIKESSSIVLENTQEIAAIVEAILQLERENEIEIILHNKLKFPHLYLVKSVFDSSSDMGAHGISEEKKIAAQEDIKWLVRLEKTILENISSSILTLSQIANYMYVSERQFHRKIRKFTGKSPNKYIREFKLEYAKEQIEQRRYKTTNEIASVVGFKDPHYFSKLFKQKFNKKLTSYAI